MPSDLSSDRREKHSRKAALSPFLSPLHMIRKKLFWGSPPKQINYSIKYKYFLSFTVLKFIKLLAHIQILDVFF